MRAAILGYGKSGQAAEKLLKRMGAEHIDIFDDRNPDYSGISGYTDIYDHVAASPGVDLNRIGLHPDNLTSEIELAYKLVPRESKIIAVTGTNGKSTVTHITAQILNALGVRAVACGNIGATFGEAVLENKADVYVLELSSFQIELLQDFEADTVIITNLAPDHLDRYVDYDEYADAKLKLLDFLKEGGKAILSDSRDLADRTSEMKLNKITIYEGLNKFPVLKGLELDFKEYKADTRHFHLYGRHNLVNLAFALEAARTVVGFEGDITGIVEGLTGLEHRCEYAGAVNGIRFINDSKGTNVFSTLACLKGFRPPVTVLLGGRDKNGDFSILADELNRVASNVIAFGEARKIIKGRLRGLLTVDFTTVKTLGEAVRTALHLSEKGDTVILSPACSSFDEFKNFEERGDYYKALVRKLGGES
ncbi:UDP-N-acetylmuramoyl-L-alanine--D-glutamate ligase [Limisalsivibrio acetivorans]|uniref:UDP-N-acetylmuramoyl-L-alanine--D-glutamate ligase n=1 Tax=Limisalsivibrio acetivorans TaxID=1304888 RepID=UPI0003B622F5|nr:UDP-N-acetylmuramoyl-L-alanine--D-glutamate ligase [Limisalsivibrio acetivorans]